MDGPSKNERKHALLQFMLLALLYLVDFSSILYFLLLKNAADILWF